MHGNNRLRENRDFRRVFQRGQSTATQRLVLYWLDNREPTFRVGFSISKKVGNAVTRNRLKRQLRACFLTLADELEANRTDFVVICRQSAADATFSDLMSDLRKLLRRAKFVI